MKNKILVKPPMYSEVELSYLCDKECKKLRSLLYKLEDDFNVSMKDHPSLRKDILDSANFIQRIPSMISDVIEVDDA